MLRMHSFGPQKNIWWILPWLQAAKRQAQANDDGNDMDIETALVDEAISESPESPSAEQRPITTAQSTGLTPIAERLNLEDSPRGQDVRRLSLQSGAEPAEISKAAELSDLEAGKRTQVSEADASSMYGSAGNSDDRAAGVNEATSRSGDEAINQNEHDNTREGQSAQVTIKEESGTGDHLPGMVPRSGSQTQTNLLYMPG